MERLRINGITATVYAFRELGIQAQNIAKVCRGERRVAGGFAWIYVDCPSVETIREE